MMALPNSTIAFSISCGEFVPYQGSYDGAVGRLLTW